MNRPKDITDLNKKPTILIDLDDTLSCFCESLVDAYNKTYNDNVLYQNIQSWNIEQYIKPEVGYNIFELTTKDNFLLNVPPQPNSIRVTQLLSKYYELYILTACVYPQNIIDKFKWVEKHFPHIGKDNIITAKNKGLFAGDYMIDDYANNLIASKCHQKMLFYAPHNVSAEIEDDIMRVSGWEEILWYFAGIDEELKSDAIENAIGKEFDENAVVEFFQKNSRFLGLF